MSQSPQQAQFGASRMNAGFTLVELLVALALVGAVLAGLLSLTRSALGFTSLTTSVATSVESIAQAEGYLSDMFRVAKRVDATQTLRIKDGASITEVPCDLDGDLDGDGTADIEPGRCLSVLTPALGSAVDQPIVDFDLSFFRVQPIGELYREAGLPRGFDGENTLALVEYRIESICSVPPSSAPCSRPPATLTDAQRTFDGSVGVLVPGISAVDGSGVTVKTFDVDTTGGGGTMLFLRIVARVDSAAGSPFAVRETPVELGVAVRGIIEPE